MLSRKLAAASLVLGVAMALPDMASADVTLNAPEVQVLEGDRRVDIYWTDRNPEEMVKINQPVLGTLLIPWRGNAKVEADGDYAGGCDWTFNFNVQSAGEALQITWAEVVNWKTKVTTGRSVIISDLDTFYEASHGIRFRVKSDSLFTPHTSDWHGVVPEFGGIYVARGETDPQVPVHFTFRCTSGGTLGTDSVAFTWQDDLGNSGSFKVEDDLWIPISNGFKIRFSGGQCVEGESLGVDLLIPLVLGDQFSITAETFDGYLILRHSVEDRSTPDWEPVQYKIIANISKCDTFEFFLDENGEYDPDGTRHYTDMGVRVEQEGVDVSQSFETVLNGFPYDYVVVTYDWTADHQQVMSKITPEDWKRVFPSVPPAKSVARVNVVPNPYVAKAGWEIGEPKIQFVNIPRAAKIRIYDAAGGYINTVYPNYYSYDPNEPQGTADWNLKDSDGKDVVSGVYIYRVESSSGTKIGRFVVVR